MSEEKLPRSLSDIEKLQRLQKKCNETYQEYLDIKRKNLKLADITINLHDRINAEDYSGDPSKKNIDITIDLVDKNFIKLRDSVIKELGDLANYFTAETLDSCLLYNYTLLATYYSFKGYVPEPGYNISIIQKSWSYLFNRGYHGTHKCCNWCETKIKHKQYAFYAHFDSIKCKVKFMYYSSTPQLYSLFPNIDYKTMTTSMICFKSARRSESLCSVDLYYKPIDADKQ
jgi:hypothetical protein